MTYENLANELKTRFPSLAPRLDEEQAKWEPDPVGGDILLADVFVPFLVEALRALPRSEVTVERGAQFIEDLAASDDPQLKAAARISVLQALEDYPRELDSWAEHFGPATRSLLPTRRHGE